MADSNIPKAPEGYAFVGWYLPAVKMVFSSPSRGHEDRFIPLFKKVEE